MPYKATERQRAFQGSWVWRRRMAWVLENGPCQVCGSSQDLRVVFKDPKDKVMKVASIWSRKEEDRVRLLAKCQVLCTVCAKDKRKVERQPEHGEVGRYDQSCRCPLCREAKRIAMAEYRARKKLTAGVVGKQ